MRKNKIKVVFTWEDSKSAGVKYIKCECGCIEDYGDRDILVNHGETWTCPKCGLKIKWMWKGMVWKKIKNR